MNKQNEWPQKKQRQFTVQKTIVSKLSLITSGIWETIIAITNKIKAEVSMIGTIREQENIPEN